MITIVNYGIGNIKSIASAIRQTSIEVTIATSNQQLADAKKLILPGVGSFDHAMECLNNSGMRDILEKLVIEKKIPLLGICVGMQMLANNSAEGKLKGLGWIDAEVVKLENNGDERFVLPHMGYNSVEPLETTCQLLTDMPQNPHFYFLHSYHLRCNNSKDVVANTTYGSEFPSILNDDNIYGVQFHPEKSHYNGMKLFKNFTEI